MTGWNLWVRPDITKEENVILKIIKLHKIKTKEWHAGKNNHLQIMGSQYQRSKRYSEFRWEEQHVWIRIKKHKKRAHILNFYEFPMVILKFTDKSLQ